MPVEEFTAVVGIHPFEDEGYTRFDLCETLAKRVLAAVPDRSHLRPATEHIASGDTLSCCFGSSWRPCATVSLVLSQRDLQFTITDPASVSFIMSRHVGVESRLFYFDSNTVVVDSARYSFFNAAVTPMELATTVCRI